MTFFTPGVFTLEGAYEVYSNRVQISHSDSLFCINVERPCQVHLLHRMPDLVRQKMDPSSQSRRHSITAGWKARALQDKDRRICLLSQEMGEAQLKIITQTFCAVKEMSSDSTKLLVSCCERSVSGLPRNVQERKGWLSLGSPCLMKTPAQWLPRHCKCTEGRWEVGERSR